MSTKFIIEIELTDEALIEFLRQTVGYETKNDVFIDGLYHFMKKFPDRVNKEILDNDISDLFAQALQVNAAEQGRYIAKENLPYHPLRHTFPKLKLEQS